MQICRDHIEKVITTRNQVNNIKNRIIELNEQLSIAQKQLKAAKDKYKEECDSTKIFVLTQPSMKEFFDEML